MHIVAKPTAELDDTTASPIIDEPESPKLFPLAASSKPNQSSYRRVMAWALVTAIFLVATFVTYHATGSVTKWMDGRRADPISAKSTAVDRDNARPRGQHNRKGTQFMSQSPIALRLPSPPAPSAPAPQPESMTLSLGWARAVYAAGYASIANETLSVTSYAPRPLLLRRGRILSVPDEDPTTKAHGVFGDRGTPVSSPMEPGDPSSKVGTAVNLGRGAKALLVVPIVSAATALARPAATRLVTLLLALARRFLPAHRCRALARFASTYGLGDHPSMSARCNGARKDEEKSL